jgi:hypothetical protein
MIVSLARLAALIGLSAFVAFPLHAQTSPNSKADSVEAVTLAQPIIFEITPSTGSLKETVQKGQQLAWRRWDSPDDPKFQVTNIAVAFLRNEPTGEVKMTFAGKISSSGFSTVDEVKLNVIVRTKGGAPIYSWSPVISVKCADKNQPLVPPHSYGAERHRRQCLHQCRHCRDCGIQGTKFSSRKGSPLPFLG